LNHDIVFFLFKHTYTDDVVAGIRYQVSPTTSGLRWMADFDFSSGEPERCADKQQQRRTLSHAPSFSDKRMLKEDDSLHAFCWPLGARELVLERKRVRDILLLRAKVKQPTDMMGYLGMDLTFDEAFIDSHDKRIELTDRLHTQFNTHAKADIVSRHDKCQSGLLAAYNHAKAIVQGTRENLLEMQALYEDLRPQTQALIRRCTSPVQLDKSMLAMQKAPAQGSSHETVFKPPCGFRFEGRVTLRDRIACIDVQMARLKCEKDVLMGWQQDAEMHAAELEVYTILHKTLAQGKCMEDPSISLQYATHTIAPQQHIIRSNTTSFKNTLEAFPVSYPSVWTREDAANFLQCMSDALELDHKQLCKVAERHMKTDFEW
jgi:hypothetical protein